MKKIIALLLLTVLVFPAVSQRSIEALGMVGYTAIDPEEWNGGELADWGLVTNGYYLQGYFLEKDDFLFGLELGYAQYFCFTVPFTGADFYIGATRLMALGRYSIDEKLFVEGGLGMAFFDDTTDETITEPTLAIGIGYKFYLSDNLYLPAKFRTDFVTTDPLITTLTLSTGLGFQF